MTLPSLTRSRVHDSTSMSARSICTLRPTVPLVGNSKSSSSASTSVNAETMSAMFAAWLSTAAIASATVPSSRFRVSRNASTLDSSRLSRFTVMSLRMPCSRLAAPRLPVCPPLKFWPRPAP